MPRMVRAHNVGAVVHAGDAISFMSGEDCIRATLVKSTETRLDVTVEAADGSFQAWEIGREEEWKLGWYDSNSSCITTSIADLMRNSQLAAQQVEPVSNSCALTLTARAVPLNQYPTRAPSP